MESLVILIPISILLMGVAAAIFLWAVDHNQFESLETHGFDILENDEPQQTEVEGDNQ